MGIKFLAYKRLVEHDSDLNVLIMIGKSLNDLHVCLCLFWKDNHNGDFFREEFLKLIIGLNDLDFLVDFLVNEGHHCVLSSLSVVVSGLSIDKELYGWETLNSELFSKLLVNSGVYFGNFDFRAVGVEMSGKLGISRGHLLAVTTPGGVELNKDKFLCLNELLGIGILQGIDSLVQVYFYSVYNA